MDALMRYTSGWGLSNHFYKPLTIVSVREKNIILPFWPLNYKTTQALFGKYIYLLERFLYSRMTALSQFPQSS